MSHPRFLSASPSSHPVRVDVHSLPHHSSPSHLHVSNTIVKPSQTHGPRDNAAAEPGAYERDLDKNRANYCALDPCDFLRRAAQVFPKRIAMIDPATELDVGHATSGPRFVTYAEMYTRCRRFAHALTLAGIRRGDCVATFSYNTIPALEASFGVPFIGAIINAINFRLNGHEVAFILRHSETKLVFCHVELASVMLAALAEHEKMSEQTGVRIPLPQLVYIHDPNDEERTRHLGRHLDYESFLMGPGVDPNFECPQPRDDWDSICLNYTSGTTGDPKGVVFSNRGVYLAALGQCVEMGMSPSHWTPTVVDAGRAVDANALPLNITYLWSLPLFHCSGWTYPYAVTAVAGTHVLLRKVRPRSIFDAVRNFKVTHLCGAPTVLDAIAFAPADEQFVPPYIVQVLTGGSAPPERVFGIMRKLNFNVTHIYGLTEVYGPTSICEYQNEWDDYNPTQLAHAKSQQGVRYLTQAEMIVGHTEVGPDGKVKVVQVPRDDKTLGEVLFRGNITMKGYLKNPRASTEAFEGGYFHSGDMASVSPSGYIQIKDRSKDIIISGGENISSLEVQAALMRHPAVLNAAVVAMPHHKWGETPIAFVELKTDHLPAPTEKDIFDHCREQLATYKCPTKIVFGALPMTSTGEVQKFKLRKIAVDLAHRIGEDTFGTFTAQGAADADQEEDTSQTQIRAKL